MTNILSPSYLAGSRERLWAYLIDYYLPLAMLVVLVIVSEVSGVEWISVLWFLAYILFMVYQLFILSKDGQTIGKKIFNIRIINNETGENAGFVRAVLLRLFLNQLIMIIPGYFFVDALFTLRRDRRAIHDHIAGTRVVYIISE